MGEIRYFTASTYTFVLAYLAIIRSGDGKPGSIDTLPYLLGDDVHIITDPLAVPPKAQGCGDGYFFENSTNSVEIVPRREWNSQELKDEYDTRTSPVSYLIISQSGQRCLNSRECKARMQQLSNSTPVIYFESFYIGEDGKVYEGLGWDTYKKHIVGGLDKWSLWITFWGNFQETSPSRIALDALKGFIKTGVGLRKISPNYKVTSARAVLEDKEYFLDKFIEKMECWDRYRDQLETPFKRHYPTAGLFPVVFREEWNATKASRQYEPISTPIQYIMVTSYVYRCFATDSCVKIMRDDQTHVKGTYGDVLLNFYVGEDGLAYEGRGWDLIPSKPHKVRQVDLPRNLIAVGFHGVFKSIKPTRAALVAFQKLLRFGVLLGKISPTYEIVSGRIMAEYMVGDGLQSELLKMERYQDTLSRK